MEELIVKAKSKKTNPFDRSNVLSQLCFCWLLPYFRRGYRKVLTEDDIYDNRIAHDSEILGTNLEPHWENRKKNGINASLSKALCSLFLVEYLYISTAAVITKCLRLAQPFLIWKILKLYDENKSSESQLEIYIFTSLLILSLVLTSLSYHNFALNVTQVGLKMKTACSSLIYRKSLKLSQRETQRSAGHILNLLSNDVGRLENTVYLNQIFMAPIETVVVIALIYMSIGWYGLVGAAFLISSMFISIYLAKKIAKYRMNVAKCTDKRLSLMNEILSGIEVMKMLALEEPFEKKVMLARDKEIKMLRFTSMVRGLTMFGSLIYPKVALLLSILVYISTDNLLTSSYVFTLTTFFRVLISATMFFPIGLRNYAEMSTSIKRIQDFLLSEDISHSIIPRIDRSLCEQKDCQISVKNVAIEAVNLINVSSKWPSSSEDILKNINLKVKSGDHIAIVGPSGSGKTTLLNTILQELTPTEGSVSVSGIISYASQDPWLFGGTLKENILFGEPYNENKYNEVIRVCSLVTDFKNFSFGDGTRTGDTNLTLSGGQKARINLARAIYRNADIFLLDDPLSTVDSHVANGIFDSCILGYLKNKTVFLVTHQTQYLRKFEHIFSLKDGSLEYSCTYHQFKNNMGDTIEEKVDILENNEERAVVGILHKDNQKLQCEGRSTGKIAGRVYISFFLAGGNWMRAFLVLFFFALSQTMDSLLDYFMAFWINAEERNEQRIGSLQIGNNTQSTTKSQKHVILETVFFGNSTLLYYVILFFLAVLLTLTKSLYFYLWCIRVSKSMHKNIFNKIIHMPMNFFNKNPSGRILNRFSKDLGNLDEVIPVTMTDTLNIGLNIISICVVVGTVTPWILGPSVLMFLLFYYMRKVFLETSRDVKRIEAITRAPLYTQLSETLRGITTIRAFTAEDKLKKQFDVYQNIHTSASFIFLGATRTYGFWLDMACVMYVFCVMSFLLFIKKETFGGNIGLALTQAMGLTMALQRGMRMWGELENQMISIERIQEYSDLEREHDKSIVPRERSLKKGRIVYGNVTLRYSKESSLALNNVSFTVEPKQKIGIVGRTGAGKSSLLQALLRLTEIEGNIYIDNTNTQDISLKTLRSNISVIPQVPTLFPGSIRKNLDPYEDYIDEILWKALEEVGIKSKILGLPKALDTSIGETGFNFSIGQKQLLCLARALIHHNHILFLDEATSNIDFETDSLIQETIKSKFSESTVLIVSHRWHTIMHLDKILVMDNGKIIEFDEPDVLVQNKDGYFSSLITDSRQNDRRMPH